MKALKISILGAGLLSLISCNEFLDRYPYSENSSSTMFSSATLAESVVTGGYSNLLYDYNSTDRSVLNWDSFSSVMDPQEGIVNLDYNYLFGTLQPNNSMFQTYWKRFYEGINRANDVIENIGRVPGHVRCDEGEAHCRVQVPAGLSLLSPECAVARGSLLRPEPGSGRVSLGPLRRRRRSGDLS